MCLTADELRESIPGKNTFYARYSFNGYIIVFYDNKECIFLEKTISIETLRNFIQSFDLFRHSDWPWPCEIEAISIDYDFETEGPRVPHIGLDIFKSLLQKMEELNGKEIIETNTPSYRLNERLKRYKQRLNENTDNRTSTS